MKAKEFYGAGYVHSRAVQRRKRGRYPVLRAGLQARPHPQGSDDKRVRKDVLTKSSSPRIPNVPSPGGNLVPPRALASTTIFSPAAAEFQTSRGGACARYERGHDVRTRCRTYKGSRPGVLGDPRVKCHSWNWNLELDALQYRDEGSRFTRGRFFGNRVRPKAVIPSGLGKM